MNGQDFYDGRSRFYYERSRFSWWQVEIFMVTGRVFVNEELRLSWWEVEILLWTATTPKGLELLSPCHKQKIIITILPSTRPKKLTKKWKNISLVFWLTFFISPLGFMCQFHFHLYSQILYHFDFVSRSISTWSWFRFYFVSPQPPFSFHANQKNNLTADINQEWDTLWKVFSELSDNLGESATIPLTCSPTTQTSISSTILFL